jgi:hypothetical protein
MGAILYQFVTYYQWKVNISVSNNNFTLKNSMLQNRRSQNIIPKDSLVSFMKFCSLKIIFLKISTFLKVIQLVSKLPRYWSGEEKSHHREEGGGSRIQQQHEAPDLVLGYKYCRGPHWPVMIGSVLPIQLLK